MRAFATSLRIACGTLNPCLSFASAPDDDCLGTVNVNVLLSQWEAVAAKPNHFLMEAGHKRSEGEEVVGSLREHEIARKPE
jgi:hypothetical protein